MDTYKAKNYEKRKDKQMKRVYICSPLSAETREGIEANMLYARSQCKVYEGRGFHAWAPHAWLPEFMDDSDPIHRDMALRFGMEMLANSDAIAVCGSKISSGMKAEILVAIQLKKTIIIEENLREEFVEQFSDSLHNI